MPVVVSFDMDWLKPRLREIKKTAADMGRALGIPKSRIYEMQRGDRKFQQHEISAAARFLQMPEAELLARLTSSGQKPGVVFVDRDNLPPVGSMPRDVPVLGTVSGGAGGLQMNGEPLDFVRRPPRYQGRSDLFAVLVEELSMVPRYGPGDLIYVERLRKPQNGDHVVVEIKDNSHDDPRAIIKRLVSQSAEKIVLEQYNPPKTFDVMRKHVVSLYRVVPLNDLLGV